MRRRVVEESTVPRAATRERAGARAPAPAPASAVSPPAPSQVPPPQLGRYQVLFELARGGIGTVYAGRLLGAHGFDRVVAIKRLTTPSGGEDEVAAFLAEARLTARIRHANVVQTLELGEDGGNPFIVMELVEGVSMARLLRRLAETEEHLEPRLAAWVVAQAAAGLHAAHELRGGDDRPLGLVHRDVSPENILLSYDGRVYVADFGVAKLAHSHRATESGVVKGKFAYMSPEQTRAGELDRRSDVFSAGVVLHEALTGERLFASSSPADTIRRIGEDKPTDPSTLRPEVPPAIADVALRALAKDREARFATAVEMAEALRRALREERTPVDESDLAELLARVFPGERERLQARIEGALADDDAAPEIGERSDSVAGRSGSVTAAIRVPVAQPRRWLGPGAAVFGALVVLVVVYALRASQAPAPEANASGAPPEPTAGATAPALAPKPTETAVALPTATAGAASASASTSAASATSSVASPSARVAPPPARPGGTGKRLPGGASTAAPSPSATPSGGASHKGEPFRDL
jgi:eukaryotic-like serine/threonine-protein kinase